jgi:microcystin-dependent protein
MSTPFIGQVEIFSFNFAPKGWALCNGQLLPINQNQPLFALLGTMYGGDGRVNFALPDLRSRIPISFGQQNIVGQRGGEESHTLNLGEMAQHNHPLNGDAVSTNVVNSPGTAGSTVLGVTAGAITPSGTFTVNMYSTSGPTSAMAPAVISNNGGGQAHTNIQPYLTLNFCIALQGIFPSQN